VVVRDEYVAVCGISLPNQTIKHGLTCAISQ